MVAFTDFISIRDFQREDIEIILKTTDSILADLNRSKVFSDLRGKICAGLFIEPSVQTRLSFEAAVKKLGGETVGFETQYEARVPEESFMDIVRILDGLADCIVVRNTLEGSARLAAEIADVPVINAGDGYNQHPTQAAVDLYSIYSIKHRMDNLTLGLIGDLSHSRAMKSLAYGLSLFKNNEIIQITPSRFRFSRQNREELVTRGLKVKGVERLEECLPQLDVLEISHVPQTSASTEEEPVELSQELLDNAKRDLAIFHPFSRASILPKELMTTPHASYIEQTRWSLPVRMAILKLILVDDKSKSE